MALCEGGTWKRLQDRVTPELGLDEGVGLSLREKKCLEREAERMAGGKGRKYDEE